MASSLVVRLSGGEVTIICSLHIHHHAAPGANIKVRKEDS